MKITYHIFPFFSKLDFLLPILVGFIDVGLVEFVNLKQGVTSSFALNRHIGVKLLLQAGLPV
jgi:hypothetical protein